MTVNPFIDWADPEASAMLALVPAELEVGLSTISQDCGGLLMHVVRPHGVDCVDGPHGWLYCIHPGRRPDLMYQAPTLTGAVGLCLLGMAAAARAGDSEAIGEELAHLGSIAGLAFDPESGCIVPLLEPPGPA